MTYFKWLSFEYGYGKAYSIEDILKRIQQLTVIGDANDKLINIDVEAHNLKINTKQLIGEYKISKIVQRYIYIMKEYVYLRNRRLEYYSECGYYAKPLFLEIGKRLNLDYEDVFSLLERELKDSITNGLVVSNSIIQDRKYKYGIILENGKFELFHGDDADKIDEPVLNNQKITHLTGDIANSGFAQGLAKIILGEEDFYKVKKGDVVVVVSTTPKWNPILEISSAIIADMGGMTSHAAKISTELGIPCIIGTKIGTKVFQDGDILQVDANNGKILRLEKS
jgi:phosphohistidine swiveling domain-containing protein